MLVWLQRLCVVATLAQLSGGLLLADEPAGKASAGAPDSASNPRPKPTTPRERAEARRAAKDAAYKSKHKEEHDRWLAKLKDNDVEPWPESETDEEHDKALTDSREMVAEVVKLFP